MERADEIKEYDILLHSWNGFPCMRFPREDIADDDDDADIDVRVYLDDDDVDNDYHDIERYG